MSNTVVDGQSLRRVPAERYRLASVVRSEWTKLHSLRSIRWTLLAMVVATVVIGVVVSSTEATHVAHESATKRTTFDPTNWSLSVLGFTQLAVGMLGAPVMSGEYSGGAIRTALLAVPDRLRLLSGKIIVLGLCALVVGEVVTFAMFFAGQALLRSAHAPSAALGQPGVLAAAAWSGAFLALLGVLGLGLGAIFRRSAAAIGAYVGVLFPLTILLASFGAGSYTPEVMLLNSVTAVRSNAPHGFLPPGGESVGVMAIYAVTSLVAGAVLFVRRDA